MSNALSAVERWKQQNRNRLLEHLRSSYAGDGLGRPVRGHEQAENLILTLVDDPEIRDAWILASRKWSY